MQLYHYTSVPLLHSILNEGISRGHLLLMNDEMRYGYCWYTTSALPYGHGLPDGSEILSESDKAFAVKAAGERTTGSVNRLQNKRLIRISVNTDWLRQQPGFCKFTRLLKENNQPARYAKAMGVSGWVKPDTLSDAELLRWMKSPKLRHDTWYLHKGTLPPEQILKVEFMEKPDIYVPYDFEAHGRAELEQNGIYCISETEHDALNGENERDPFLKGSVSVICPHPATTPAIVFRKGHGALVLAIEDGRTMGSGGNDFAPGEAERLGSWTKSRAACLMPLWEKSLSNWKKVNS